MLSIIQSVRAIGVSGITIPFGVTGGIAPYTWSLQPGGVGGSIDTSSGAYTGARSLGSDTVVVTDSTLATASYVISCLPPLQLVCDVIKTAMSLSDNQVYVWDAKINIPTDSALYVAVGVTSSRAFGNNTDYVGTVGNFKAIQSVNVLDTLSIDILSRGPAARDQKELVLLALNSPYAESQMELNSFFVAPQSTNFVNLSEIDGSAIPYRFNISVSLQYFVTNESNPPYYDSFTNPPTTVTEP